MGNKEFDNKELMMEILNFEKERQIEIASLIRELDELETSEARDSKRIDEIVAELKIINPLPEDDNYENFKKILQARVKQKKRRLANSLNITKG